MAYKSTSGFWSSGSTNQRPYSPPQPTPIAPTLRAINHATAHSGAPWNFCSACGEQLEHDAHFCHECGTDVGKIQLVSDLVPIMCACNRALKKEYKFCPGCKAVVDKSWERANACGCGTINLLEAGTCVACGKKMNTGPAKRKTG